jgi:hypothetical protein
VIVAVVPVALLVPWVLDLATHPARIFLEAGVVLPGLADPHLAPRSLLLLSPGGPGLPPYWVTGGVALVAAAALGLAIGRRAPLVLAGWVVAVTGLITAALVSHLAITQAGTAGAVQAWPGPALAVAGAGLLLAVVAASDQIPGQLRAEGWRSVAGLSVLGLGALALSAPALAATYWVSSGVTGPVRPVPGPLLPEFVSVSAQSGLRPRTLVLQTSPGGAITYTVLRDSDPLIGSQELPLPMSAQRALNLCVATLTAQAGGAAADQGKALASFGIGYVMLPAPINGGLARRLDGVAGLRPVSVTGQFDLWRVANSAAQVMVVEPGGNVVAVPSGPVTVDGAKAPAAGGTLLVAGPAGGWSASLNGHSLTPAATPANGWAQAFRLPPGGGSLSVGRSQVGRDAVVGAEVLAVLVVAGLGLPGARVAGEAQPAAASAEDDLDGEELAGAGRSGRARDRAGRRRSSHRGKAAPDLEPGTTEIPRPAAPAVASRLRGAVPAGMRVGWPRRGAGPAEAGPAFADEPAYDEDLVGPEDSVPRQPEPAELSSQTVVLGARGEAGGGRHGHGRPADADPPAGTGQRREFGLPGRRRRPGGDAEPPPQWSEGDPRDRSPARAGGPAAHGRGDYPGSRRDTGDQAAEQTAFIGGVPGARDPGGPARASRPAADGRGDYPDSRRDTGDQAAAQTSFIGGVPVTRYPGSPVSGDAPGERGDYPDSRRSVGRRAAPAPGGAPPGGPGGSDYPDARRGLGRRAAPGPGAAPGGRGGDPGPRRGLGRRAGPVRGAGGSAPGGREDYPGPRPGDPPDRVPAPGDHPDARRAVGRRAASGSRDEYPGARRGAPQGDPGRREWPGGRGPEPGRELPRRPMPRGGPPGGDALSPLPPLPPRAPRRNRWDEDGPQSDGAGPGQGPGRDQAPDDQWDRAQHDERDERDW